MEFVCGFGSASSSSRLPDASQEEAFFDLVALLPRGRSLDLETGQGVFAGLASSLGFSAVGVDLREEAVFEARRNYPDAVFAAANSRKLPLRWKREFALVSLMSGGLSRFDDAGKRKVLRSAASALKSGGFLVVSDWNRCGGVPGCKKTGRDWKECRCAGELAGIVGDDFEVKKVVTYYGSKMFVLLAEKL